MGGSLRRAVKAGGRGRDKKEKKEEGKKGGIGERRKREVSHVEKRAPDSDWSLK